MPYEFRNYSLMAMLCLGVLTVAGCKPRQNATTSGAVGTPADTGMRATSDTSQMKAGGELTDPNIVALLDEANMADSAAGAFALTKATNPEVKAFAKMMMGEHHALRLQGQQLAKRLNVTPEPPANDPLKPAAQGEMSTLRSTPKGARFDRAYIDQEVEIHKAVLDLADKAHGSAQNEDLKKLIEQAKPVLEKHLNKAEEIQKKLGKPTA